MTNSNSSQENRKLVWAHVYRELRRYAIPDSRFHYDFMSFTPDFQGSSSVVDRIVGLSCYQKAQTVLVTSDNSLEKLRLRALQDGKRLLVATYRLRRGFVLLNPAVIHQDNYAVAACLDGMEKPGVGRLITLAQARDENVSVDLCVTGGLAFNQQGITIWEGHSLFEVQWAMLQDIKCLDADVPVVAAAHTCQVVDEAKLGIETTKADDPGEVQCNYVVTPDHAFHIENPFRPTGNMDLAKLDQEALSNIPPLQELKGIRMMEKIMQDGGIGQEKREQGKPKTVSVEEKMGIDIVEKLMKDYKP